MTDLNLARRTTLDPAATRTFDSCAQAFARRHRSSPTQPPDQQLVSVVSSLVRAHPDNADVLLMAVAAGRTDPGTLFHLYRVRATLGAQLLRSGHTPSDIAARFATGLYLDCPIVGPDDAAAAYAARLIADGEFSEAAQVLSEVRDSPSPTVRYVRAVLAYRTARWPDVLAANATNAADDSTDPLLDAATALMVGTACAQLSMFTEATHHLTIAEEGPIPDAAASAAFTRALVLREQGEAEDAQALLERVAAQHRGFAEAARAAADPSYRLVLTSSEHIATRADPYDPSSQPESTVGDQSMLADAREQLNRQVGIAEVKQQVLKLESAARMAQVRRDRGLATTSRSLHMAFTGPPGTGKTTIAAIVAKMYRGLGLLATDTVVTATRADLVGEHLGSTALKTGRLIDSAMDGVLFIDEAYTLIQSGLSGGDAFGREALDTLLARMENDRDRLVVIIAGYDAEIDRFLAANEGLDSRFARRIRFASYSPSELTEIASVIARQSDSLLSNDALTYLHDVCNNVRDSIDTLGNARFVRNVIEAAEDERELRLAASIDSADLDDDALMRLTDADVRMAATSLLGPPTFGTSRSSLRIHDE